MDTGTGTKEDVIILLNEAQNKINKTIMIYSKYDKDDVYLKTIRDLLRQEIADLTNKNKYSRLFFASLTTVNL